MFGSACDNLCSSLWHTSTLPLCVLRRCMTACGLLPLPDKLESSKSLPSSLSSPVSTGWSNHNTLQPPPAAAVGRLSVSWSPVPLLLSTAHVGHSMLIRTCRHTRVPNHRPTYQHTRCLSNCCNTTRSSVLVKTAKARLFNGRSALQVSRVKLSPFRRNFRRAGDAISRLR